MLTKAMRPLAPHFGSCYATKVAFALFQLKDYRKENKLAPETKAWMGVDGIRVIHFNSNQKPHLGSLLWFLSGSACARLAKRHGMMHTGQERRGHNQHL